MGDCRVKMVDGYVSKLGLRDTQRAIKVLKDTFERIFADSLNLERISAPILVSSASGINDDLNGVERIVRFDLKSAEGEVEIVQSLAKWKRLALFNYGFGVGEGLYTDMNAIRRDDSMDNIHSVYVDQWDWELIISRGQRCMDFLQSVVRRIVNAICDAQDTVKRVFPAISCDLCRNVYFISSEELLQRYPDLSAKERENAIVREKKTVFISQIGGALSNGLRHDGRAPDYDDWSLNGDILFWNEVLGEAIEISSMGIRVDAASMSAQLAAADCESRRKFPFHAAVLADKLPLTIGGGIGQSRLCLLILQKLHIGEVQVSVWSDEMVSECERLGVRIL